MMRIRPIACLLVICSAMLIALPARAAIIYNNGPINGRIESLDIAAVREYLTASRYRAAA